MFTFCFTTVAAAQLRRNRETRKTTRNPIAALRTVRLGLASMAVLAMAGMAQAGGISHSLGNFTSTVNKNSGSNVFSQPNQAKNFALNNSKPDSHKPISLDPKTTKTLVGTDNFKSSIDKIAKTSVNTGMAPIKLTGKETKNFALGISDKNGNGKSCDPCHKCCHCCPWWYCWNYPCWCPLYSCGCGCWDDVPVMQCDQGYDLQLLAVRMLDSGDPDKQLGPAFRVWFRNNSEGAINHPFNVLILAARDTQPTADLPQAGVRVDSIDAGQTVSVDIRLPVEANQPGFPMLHVLVDSHREITEVNETNNGLVINRSEILPVDMAQATSSGNTPAGAPPAPAATNDAPAATGSTAAPTTTGAATAGSDNSQASDSGNSTIPVTMQGVVAN